MTEKQQLILAILLCCAYAGWVAWLVIRHWRQKRAQQHVDTGNVVVAYASQTGTAKQIAEQQAADIAKRQPVTLIALSDLTLEVLGRTEQALFVVSTYGNGEPPDNGRGFARKLQHSIRQKMGSLLDTLAFRVVALGDSSYPDFCAFGEQLNANLKQLGASESAPIERIDRVGSQALIQAASDYSSSHHSPSMWRVTQQQQLNKGAGRELYLVTLSATAPLPHWQAGDILDVQPHNSSIAVQAWLNKNGVSKDVFVPIDGTPRPIMSVLQARQLNELPQVDSLIKEVAELPLLPLRSYSIASVPAEGHVKLIIRKQYTDSGAPGLGSGWLTTFADYDDVFCAYLKDNPVCHIANTDAPLLLIGAGSGLAGLRSHLAARVNATSEADIWLIYGEQSPDNDDVLGPVLGQWQEESALSLQVHKVFSRTEQGQYVQDAMRNMKDELRNFIERGAHIYVCGSHKGMGEAVHNMLITILGEDAFADIVDEQRYHRDTY